MLATLKRKWRRQKMGRNYRHMAELHPQLALDLDSNPQRVLWQGNEVATLAPIHHDTNASNDWAFIVGSGPSLKDIDISAIAQHKSVGVNGSVMKFIEHNIAPDYYVIADANFIRERWTIVQQMLALKPHCFFTPSVISAICAIDANQLSDVNFSVFNNHFKNYNQPVTEYTDIIQLAANDSDIITHDGKVGFSLNPNKGVFTAHTVVYHALQIAYGLGYRRIGILGMDLSENTASTPTRFYETGRHATPSHVSRDYADRILPSFMVVKYLCERNLLSVYNLSPNSRLPAEVIPKTELSMLLASTTNIPSSR